MEFLIADTFTDSLARLTGEEQKQVKTTAFDLQMNPASPGHRLHRLEESKDPNFWSVRAGRDLRLIVHKAGARLVLCYVDHHDSAYRWAARRRLEAHPKTGAAQLVEIRETVREVVRRVEAVEGGLPATGGTGGGMPGSGEPRKGRVGAGEFGKARSEADELRGDRPGTLEQRTAQPGANQEARSQPALPTAPHASPPTAPQPARPSSSKAKPLSSPYAAGTGSNPSASRQPRQGVPLFADRSPAELLGYGVPEEWLEEVRQADEDQLLELADHLPAEAAEALLELATGGKPRPIAPATAGADPFAHPDAQRRFRVMHTPEELQRALDAPWEKWIVFLHPEQRQWVERDYAGPARVSGSAGTGKTIVALHRAAHLARQHPDARVLLTTFTDALASSLAAKLRRLIGGDPRLAERIDTDSLTNLGLRLHRAHLGPANLVSRDEVRRLLEAAAAAIPGHRFQGHFLIGEWEQVVDAWQLGSFEAYRDVPRLGRKVRLPEPQRRILWTIFDRVRQELAQRHLTTESAIFTRLAQALNGESPTSTPGGVPIAEGSAATGQDRRVITETGRGTMAQAQPQSSLGSMQSPAPGSSRRPAFTRSSDALPGTTPDVTPRNASSDATLKTTTTDVTRNAKANATPGTLPSQSSPAKPNRPNPPYDFAVIDEAQDLSIAHLRFFAALGQDRPNALFFAGDIGQRIFQNPFSWKSLGIDIRGRSRTLRINYRTSHQIRQQADRLLARELTDADGNAEDRSDTISVFNGPPPEIRVLPDEPTEIATVAAWIRARLASGTPPHAIGL